MTIVREPQFLSRLCPGGVMIKAIFVPEELIPPEEREGFEGLDRVTVRVRKGKETKSRTWFTLRMHDEEEVDNLLKYVVDEAELLAYIE